MPGYSQKPVADKLGFKPEQSINVINPPENYRNLLGESGKHLTITETLSSPIEVMHLFATARLVLLEKLEFLRENIKQDGYIWVSWPKKKSGVTTDITEDTIREIALPLGFVDIKVCAVSDLWSGLKLVIRKELRIK